MLTAAATGFRSLVAVRFFFGAGEAGAFPAVSRGFSRWLPQRERGTANGVLFLGSRVGGMVLLSTIASDPAAKAVLLAFALASADFALGACWAVCLDVGGAHAGVVTGFMNTFGNVGGLIGPLVVGIAVDRWHSWTLPFYVTAAVYAAGALAWLAPGRKLADS